MLSLETHRKSVLVWKHRDLGRQAV